MAVTLVDKSDSPLLLDPAIGLAAELGHAMRRGRALEAQRRAAGIMLERYAAAPCLARWARAVLRCDEVRPYRLLYRVAERASVPQGADAVGPEVACRE